MSSFLSDFAISAASWQAFERMVSRLLVSEGCDYVSVVGTSGDGGADVVAIRNGRRWLYQVKRWGTPVGPETVSRTIAAASRYGADVPAIVSKSGFTSDARAQRERLVGDGINVQFIDKDFLGRRGALLPLDPLSVRAPDRFAARDYQEPVMQRIVSTWLDNHSANALAVLATGLGKTFIAAEALRRIRAIKPDLRIIVLAHANALVLQLERAFWPFLAPDQKTVVVNGDERPDWSDLGRYEVVFASRTTMCNAINSGVEMPNFDVVVVDEAHHLGADEYETVLQGLGVGAADGPFFLGLTATPWRPDGQSLASRMQQIASIDLVKGLQSGFLSNVDYRMYTDNVDWGALRALHGDRFTPRGINRTLFIPQWDDSVVEQTQRAWEELGPGARGVVFCGTIDHAVKMAARINGIGFANAQPIASRLPTGQAMSPIDRNRLLWDFADGRAGILCAVDVLNEGVDVPDINLIVFQRVTHSRRIFVQQLGRGLRIAPGKERVIVLDFVNDIRRFAAGLDLQRQLGEGQRPDTRTTRIDLPSRVEFRRANASDEDGASFLREWLGELDEVEQAGEDVSVLRFPPLDRLPRVR